LTPAVTVTVGVDVGGTKIAAGLVDGRGSVLRREVRESTGLSPAGIISAIAEVVGALRRGREDPVAVGVGAAGFIDADRTRVLFAPNLPWLDEPVPAALSAQVGLPVVLENDANAAAWAEYRFGAGRGAPETVVVTVGTGIGVGLVLGGRLYRGAAGIAGEAGHMRVVPDGRECGCGNRGCWEQYSSGPALMRAATERSASFPDGPALTEAARAGDGVAVACFADVGQWLGQGLADISAVLDPGRFVVGGGVADAGELLLAPARQRYARALTGRGHRPPAEIVAASLGADAGMVGAAELARERVCGS
jgi:glucokinase